jgi:hypothetical protein
MEMNMNTASNENIAQTPAEQESFGKLAKRYCDKELRNQVLRSAAGYYIGTADEEGYCSRESVQYFRKESDAEAALANGNWTQRLTP